MVAVATSSDMNTNFNISGRNDMGISNNGESDNNEISTLGNN